jgi:Ribbon-helix-helix protein, copG family
VHITGFTLLYKPRCDKFTNMKEQRFPHVLGVRLSEPEAEFLERLAIENDRSRSAELRRLLRERMAADTSRSGQPQPNFGRI